MQQKFLILAVVFAFSLTACGQAKDLESLFLTQRQKIVKL
jgi:hypothetical protein